MAETNIQEMTIPEKITKALDGRNQVWLVDKVKQYGEEINDEDLKRFTDVKLSRKMNNRDSWETNELKGIAKILKIKL